MSFAFLMLLLAALAPYVTVGLAKGGGGSGYDNAAPRDWAARQDGWRARAIAAQQNHFEAFPPFAAGVFAAMLGGANPATTNLLAAAFIVLRVLYTLAYLRDAATLRSVVWSLGFLCVIALFVGAL